DFGTICRLPDIPRCRMIQPVVQSIRRYFPRRAMVLTVQPETLRAKSRGTGQRSARLRTMTAATCCPCKCGTRPRRVVSTSGSSGMRGMLLLCHDARIDQATADFHTKVVAQLIVV